MRAVGNPAHRIGKTHRWGWVNLTDTDCGELNACFVQFSARPTRKQDRAASSLIGAHQEEKLYDYCEYEIFVYQPPSVWVARTINQFVLKDSWFCAPSVALLASILATTSLRVSAADINTSTDKSHRVQFTGCYAPTTHPATWAISEAASGGWGLLRPEEPGAGMPPRITQSTNRPPATTEDWRQRSHDWGSWLMTTSARSCT
jgi:hypothetical protein